MDTADDTIDSMGQLNEAKEEFIRVAGNAKVNLDNEAKSLKLLMDSTDDTSGAVKGKDLKN